MTNNPSTTASTEAGGNVSRRRRNLVIGGATAAIIGGLTAVLASGVLLGNDPATPSPGASSTASASPSPSPSPMVDGALSLRTWNPPTNVLVTGGVNPGEVTIDPSLPDALPLPDGIWNDTGPGWVLAVYSPSVTWWSDEEDKIVSEVSKQVIYLINPEGVRYQVFEVDPNVGVRLDSWDAGEATAVIHTYPGEIEGHLGPYTLNLTTGDAVPQATPYPGAYVFADLQDGTRIWTTPEGSSSLIERDGEFIVIENSLSPWFLSPDESWLVGYVHWVNPGGLGQSRLGLVSVATGAEVELPAPAGGEGCEPSEWIDSVHLLVSCYDESTQVSTFYSVDPSGGSAVEIEIPVLADDEPRVEHQVRVSPGVWAGGYGPYQDSGDMNAMVGVDDHGVFRTILPMDIFGTPFACAYVDYAVDGILYIEGSPFSCGDSFPPRTLVRYDLATDQQVVLLPAPPGGPTADWTPDSGSWAGSIGSFVVAD